MVYHKDNSLMDGSIHPLSYTILDMGVRSRKLSLNASRLTKVTKFVRVILTSNV